jgi:predicted alpha-1,6-mannanase (GH76 family)
MWLCIAMTRAYLYAGKQKYLDTAIENFELTWKRAFSPDLGGGMFWRVENQSKNTCVNCPASIAASLLAKATGKTAYYVKAALTLDWAERMMFEPDTGKVYDCIGLDKKVSKWSSTYNQGTFIGASLLLFAYTQEDRYLHHAEAAAHYVKEDMYQNGVMNNEEPGNDLPGFKGILARYVRHFADTTGKEEYRDWLRLNADSAYQNRNAEGLMRTQLAEKTEDGKDFDVFAMSAAVSVVVNSANSVKNIQ